MVVNITDHEYIYILLRTLYFMCLYIYILYVTHIIYSSSERHIYYILVYHYSIDIVYNIGAV